jgi:pimeloyl-ACP methyl ester carboxylesterase
MRSLLHRGFGLAVDQVLCGTLALLHRRHAGRVSARDAAEKYFAACERQTRAEHFARPAALEEFRVEERDTISWSSPAASGAEFPVNGRARVILHRVRPDAPTVIMLHALMSVSDLGYRQLARRFNSLGWNAAFVQLPFHYSRRPRGHLNGELCFTADLVLTGDTVRQAVVEIRQLLGWLRAEGASEFGLLATSYGGWVGALLASLEPDLRFLALLAPMVNIAHALYEGPTSWAIRGSLVRAGLDRSLVERHAHLSSPLRARPAGDVAERTIIIGGTYDRIIRLADLEALRESWLGSELLTVAQAHFGYGMIPQAMARLAARGLLDLSSA